MKLKDGNFYVVKEERNEKSFKLFSELLKEGYNGLVFTRTYPREIRKVFKIEKPMIIWLSFITENLCVLPEYNESCISPTNIAGITSIVNDFFAEEGKKALIIDGVEYLIFQNGFQSVLKFLQLANEKTQITNSILITPINTKIVSEIEFLSLSKGAEIIE